MPKNILVVDDEENIREIISEFLQTLGYQVVEASNGEEAIRACSKVEFDMVISDIRMPKMNGLKLLKSLKTYRPELPVILMTGYQPSKSQEASLTTKADGYLLKPFSLKSLRQAILKILKPYDKKKVIRNYNITGDVKNKIDNPTIIPKVVKKSSEIEDKKIEIPGETIPLNKEPVIKVNRNEQNIVTSIDVICSCGEKFSIKIDY